MTTASSSTNNNNNIIYRHEFSKEFMAHVSRFSKVHQHDDRHTYKREWTKWIQLEEITMTIDAETRRLQENGYVGDINDKMFKAGRYYFRKRHRPPLYKFRQTQTQTQTHPTMTMMTRSYHQRNNNNQVKADNAVRILQCRRKPSK